jgi:hypothetical protein
MTVPTSFDKSVNILSRDHPSCDASLRQCMMGTSGSWLPTIILSKVQARRFVLLKYRAIFVGQEAILPMKDCQQPEGARGQEGKPAQGLPKAASCGKA